MSTRFYAGQTDYIYQLNLMDDEFDSAVGTVTGKLNQTANLTIDVGSTYPNYWSKLGTITLTAQFAAVTTDLWVGLAGSSGGAATVRDNAVVTIRVKQQAAMASAPIVDLVSLTAVTGGYASNRLVAVVTQNNGSATVVDIYAQHYVTFDKIRYQFTNTFATSPSQATLATVASGSFTPVIALPAGTQIFPVYSFVTSYAGNLLLGSITDSGGSEKLQVTGNAKIIGNIVGDKVAIGRSANASSQLQVFGTNATQSVALFQSNYNGTGTIVNSLTGPKQPTVFVMGGDHNENWPGSVMVVSPAMGSGSTRPPGLYLASSRSTTAQLNANTFTPIQSGDGLGEVTFGGDDGVNVRGIGAAVAGYASENWTSTSHASQLQFMTTSTGSTSAVVRWNIRSDGHFYANTDNTYDIGSAGAFRPRNMYAAGTIHGYGTVFARYGADGEVSVGSDTNGNIEIGKLGRTASGAPFIDFHSSANSPDYDVRIQAGGGSATSGTATLTVTAQSLRVNASNQTGSSQFHVTSTGGNGANIRLEGEHATTPNKYLRSQSGEFQVLNSAYSSAILRLTDAGALTVSGGATINGGGLNVAGGGLTVSGRTVTLSNLQPEYNWRYANNSTDLNWKKIADITINGGVTFAACQVMVDVVDAWTNYGHTSFGNPMRYFVSAWRSAGAVDDQDTGSVSGPDVDYVRLVKTAIGVYELQVRNPNQHRSTNFRVTVTASGQSTITYVDNPADGSTSGTIYTASLSGYTQKLPSVNVGGNLTVTGNLTVNGTTTTTNSTTITVDDPVITLGGDTAPSSDDNKDRGVEFRWHNGSAAKVGFFGFDDSTGKFTFIPDATNSSEVFSGTAGTIVANLEGNVTGNASTVSNITRATLANGADLNTVQTSGFYRLGNPNINSPDVSADYGQMLVIQGGADTITQILSRYTDGRTWIRSGNVVGGGGAWSSWKYILTDGVTVTAAQGGTGISSYTIGDIVYASGATTLSKLAGVATGNALISGGTGTAPSWGKIGLTTHVSGTLPITSGGTGATDAGTALSNLGGITPAAVDTKLANVGLGVTTATPVVTDINSASMVSGLYYTNTSTTGTFPSAAANGFLLHRVYGTGGYQLWSPEGSDTLYQRRRTGSAWQSWKQIPMTTDVPYTPSGLSVDISSTDLNTRVLAGFYRGSTVTNAPDTGWWFVTVEAHDTNHVKQTVTAYGTPRPTYPAGTTFVRIRVSGTWGAWQSIGGGATGGGSDKAFYENDVTINTSYTIGTNKNAMSAGPITIANGVTVTIPDGSTWTVV